MSMFSHIRGMVRRAVMACSPSLIRDVEFERDNAVRQYLVTKNWALHYEMQAQKWLALAVRHNNLLDSKDVDFVARIVASDARPVGPHTPPP